MSILNKLKNVQRATSGEGRVPMTPAQEKACKAALIRDNRGPNVHPFKFDLNKPYRVALNYSNEWKNYGNFTSADTAAAIGVIVSLAWFGDKAKAGAFDADKVEADPEYQAWMQDSRNAEVIAKANGDVAPAGNDEELLGVSEADMQMF